MNKKINTNTNKTDETIKRRPPVVVVMGHVDHGKTTLLDTIRKTNVAGSETGGITQHIGAYQVKIRPDDPNSTITFIDTPGHEVFTKMRSRGATVADIAILVVAANDGVKPQTKEAISIIKKSKLPFIVAINKVDIEGVLIDKVKGQLAENEVFVEGYGGDVVAVEVSAIKGMGISQLLEMIELMYELQPMKANAEHLEAIVLESYMDNKKGAVANLLIRSGRIVSGQMLYCDDSLAKIRNMMDENGNILTEANDSQPVQILGFAKSLPVGALVTDSIEAVEHLEKQYKKQLTVEELAADDKRLKIILKADVGGTLEAIKNSLTEEILLIDEGVGDISDSDVLLAASTGARIIGFRVKLPKQVEKLAQMEEVKIQTFDIIYHLLEDLEKRVLKLIEPTINEEVLGKAEVIAEFNIKGNHICGCKVIEGSMRKSAKFRLVRDERTVFEPRVAVMQEKRIEVVEVKTGKEVALVFRPDVKFRVGDIVVCYRIVED